MVEIRQSQLRHVLTVLDATALFSLDEENLAPGEELSEEDFKEFINDVTGKTLWEYCKWRWPEEPEEQLELALSVLTFD